MLKIIKNYIWLCMLINSSLFERVSILQQKINLFSGLIGK